MQERELTKMRSCQKVLGVLVLVVASSIAGRADTAACAAGNLSSVVGTVCTIGGLTFDFTGTDLAAGYESSGFSSANIYFTPTTSGGTGFSLNTIGGPLASTGGDNSFASNYFKLFYGVSQTDGTSSIINVVATGDPNATGSPDVTGTNQYSYGYAYVDAFGCNSNGDCTYSTTYFDGLGGGGYYGYDLSGPVADLKWYGYVQFYTNGYNGGSGSISQAQILYNATQPTAGDPPGFVDGDTSVPVPEPASMTLLGAGIAALVGVRKRFMS